MSKCCKCSKCVKQPRCIKPGVCEQFHHCEKDQQPDKIVNNCKGCVCNQLRQLSTQTEVDVFLSSGLVLEDVLFISLDQKSCCAFFFDPTTEPGSTLIVDCKEIQAIRLEVG